MTIAPCNLNGRTPCPVYVQRAAPDRSTYLEADPEEIARLIRAQICEGKANRNGVVRLLRITCSESEAIAKIAAQRRLEASPYEERGGSISTMASVTVFREQLSDTSRSWTHIRNKHLSLAPCLTQ